MGTFLILTFIIIFSFFIETGKNIFYAVDKYKISKLKPRYLVEKVLYIQENILSISLLFFTIDILISNQLGYFSNEWINSFCLNNFITNFLKFFFNLILLIVNLIIKVLTLKYADKLALFLSYPTFFLYKIFSPFVFFIDFIVNTIKKIFNIKEKVLTSEDIISQIDTSIKCTLKRDVRFNIFKNAVHIFELSTRDVMIKKEEISSISEENNKFTKNDFYFVLDKDKKISHIGFSDNRDIPYVFISAKTLVIDILDVFLNYEVALVSDTNGEILGLITRQVIYSLLVSKKKKIEFKKEKNSFIFSVKSDIKLINDELNWKIPENYKNLEDLLFFHKNKQGVILLDGYEFFIVKRSHGKPVKVAIREFK